jgi:hypothetical protein
MKEKIIKLLESNNIEEVNKFINLYFNGDSVEFFKLLEKLGITDGDDIYEVLLEEMPMTYLKYKYDLNPDSTVKYITDEFFGDVTEKNSRYILTLNDREDLSIFFKDDGGRDTGSKELAKLIFQEDWWEPYYDSLQDVYEEVVTELDDKNLLTLANTINDELSGVKIEPKTSLLEDIAEDQGHSEYVELSAELILNTIFEDSETTKFLLNESTDVSSELYSLYHNAYNTAYVDEKWETATNEVKSLLSIDNIGEWSSKKVKNYKGEEKTLNYYHIDVTNFIPEVIDAVFNDRYMFDDYRNQFEYYDDFEGLVKEAISEDVIEGASMSIPYYDYPDHQKVVQYLNDFFPDYI